ncbi:MAG TPA: hypothetical protein VFB81_01185 [Myxococcales bacterium]|nr:hypothetical protein [Myxococcales bacterium]
MRSEPKVSTVSKVSKVALAALLAVGAAGCATGSSNKESWDSVFKSSRAPAAAAHAGAKGKPAAHEYIPPLDCERKARALRSSDRNAAWAALKGCAARGHFTQLHAVVASWGDDLRERPDAPVLLTQMVAARGGNVKQDVRVMRDAKIPVFSLRDCTTQPQLYEGRYVMIRGTLDEVRASGDAVAARLTEHTLQAEEWEVPIGGIRRKVATTRYGGSVSGNGTTILGNGQIGGSVDVSGDEYEVDVARRYDNVLVGTGRDAVVRVATPDPYLENGRDLVILARFDGIRPSSTSADDDEPDLVPVLTLVDYQVPDALVVDQ